jgi:hypothetical protein
MLAFRNRARDTQSGNQLRPGKQNVLGAPLLVILTSNIQVGFFYVAYLSVQCIKFGTHCNCSAGSNLSTQPRFSLQEVDYITSRLPFDACEFATHFCYLGPSS